MINPESIITRIMSESMATNNQEILDALEDGEALAAIGITDENQEAVEEARRAVKAIIEKSNQP